jgi:hypothetical protein
MSTIFVRGENPLKADKLNTAFSERVSRGGDTMQGLLRLAQDPVNAFDAATKQYVDRFTSMGVPTGAYIGAAPPGNVLAPLWWDTVSGQLFIQYNDGNSVQWVSANSGLPSTGSGSTSIINVLNHGAKGDGVTDDTAAIYDALVVYAGRATILLPAPNVFRVSYLFLPSNTDLVINGTLKANDGDDEPVLFLNNVSNIRISGYGTLDGNKANVIPNCAGINMSNASNVQVSGITIQNTFYWALNIAGSRSIRIDNVTVIGSGAGSEFAVGSDDCWLTNCTFDGTSSTDAGFTFYGGVTNSGAIGNTIKNTGIGVSMANLGLCILADGSPGDATAQGCHNIILADNLCYNNGASGIWVDVHVATIHSGIIIANNRCYNNCQLGGDSADIHIGNANDVTVIGNQSQQCKQPYGIYVNQTVGLGRTLVSGNYVIDAGYGGSAGVGLYIASAAHVVANGNYFYSPSGSMHAWLGGTAGVNNVFIGNYGGGLSRTITMQSDTMCANAEGGNVYQYAPGTVLAMASPMMITNNTSSQTPRWYMGQDGSNETGGGSNTGSNFEILSVNDAGTGLLFNCLGINRATSQVTLNVAHKLATLPVNAATDAAAASAGVSIGGEYRNGSVKMIRVV